MLLHYLGKKLFPFFRLSNVILIVVVIITLEDYIISANMLPEKP